MWTRSPSVRADIRVLTEHAGYRFDAIKTDDRRNTTERRLVLCLQFAQGHGCGRTGLSGHRGL